MTLLSNGQCLYHGPQNSVLSHFAVSGFVCEAHNNPSDFLLDVIGGGVDTGALSIAQNSHNLENGIKEGLGWQVGKMCSLLKVQN